MAKARAIWVAFLMASSVNQLSCSCSDLSGVGNTDAETDIFLDMPWDHWADSAYDAWFADTAPEVSGDWADELSDAEPPFGCPPPLDVSAEFEVDGISSPDSPVTIEQHCTVDDIRYHSRSAKWHIFVWN